MMLKHNIRTIGECFGEMHRAYVFRNHKAFADAAIKLGEEIKATAKELQQLAEPDDEKILVGNKDIMIGDDNRIYIAVKAVLGVKE